MDGFPGRADAFEDERHPAGNRFRSSFVGLRLRPKTGHDRAVSSQHVYCLVTDLQLHVFNLRI